MVRKKFSGCLPKPPYFKTVHQGGVGSSLKGGGGVTMRWDAAPPLPGQIKAVDGQVDCPRSCTTWFWWVGNDGGNTSQIQSNQHHNVTEHTSLMCSQQKCAGCQTQPVRPVK